MKHVYPITSEKQMEEYVKYLRRHSGAILSVLARLGFQTGLRISDLLKLKYSAFFCHLEAFEVTEQKTAKKREIKITPEIRDPILALKKQLKRKDGDFIFTGRYSDRPMHRSTAWRHFKRAGEALGFQAIGTHSLRKSYAIALFRASGGNLEYVRKKMNHKYTDTTLKSYVMSGISPDKLLRIYEEYEK